MERIVLALGATGLVNAQFIVRDDGVYLIEVNPRASRTVPFMSKVTGVPMVELAVRISLGATLASSAGLGDSCRRRRSWRSRRRRSRRQSCAAWTRPSGPGMQSTGEVIGIHTDRRVALAKALRNLGRRAPGELAEVAVEVRLVVVAAIERQVREVGARSQPLDGALEPHIRPSALGGIRSARGTSRRGAGGSSPSSARELADRRGAAGSISRCHAHSSSGATGGALQHAGGDRRSSMSNRAGPSGASHRRSASSRGLGPIRSSSSTTCRSARPSAGRTAGGRPAATGRPRSRARPACSVSAGASCSPATNEPKRRPLMATSARTRSRARSGRRAARARRTGASARSCQPARLGCAMRARDAGFGPAISISSAGRHRCAPAGSRCPTRTTTLTRVTRRARRIVSRWRAVAAEDAPSPDTVTVTRLIT